jgi:hypothetical protein
MGKLKGMGFLQPFDRKNMPQEWPNSLRSAFCKAYQGFDVIPPILRNINNWKYEFLVETPTVLKLEMGEFGLHINDSIVRGAGKLFKDAVTFTSWHIQVCYCSSLINF